MRTTLLVSWAIKFRVAKMDIGKRSGAAVLPFLAYPRPGHRLFKVDQSGVKITGTMADGGVIVIDWEARFPFLKAQRGRLELKAAKVREGTIFRYAEHGVYVRGDLVQVAR